MTAKRTRIRRASRGGLVLLFLSLDALGAMAVGFGLYLPLVGDGGQSRVARGEGGGGVGFANPQAAVSEQAAVPANRSEKTRDS